MLYTAQYNYKGIDRYDITVAAKNIFSPTWTMVEKYRACGNEDEYTKLYETMMRKSYSKHLQFWEEMVKMCTRHNITLVCYCKPGDFCHRVLLAGFLVKCGAKYGGER